jgi:hypothetical protein
MLVVNATAWSLYPQKRDSVYCVWNVMAHAQKPDFVFRQNGRVHLNRRGRQFSRLLAAEVCASAVVMLDTPSSEVVWRVLVTHSIASFPFSSPPVRHRVPLRFNWTLPLVGEDRRIRQPVWTGAEYLTTTEIRSQDRPARSEWVYRVTYPGPVSFVKYDG